MNRVMNAAVNSVDSSAPGALASRVVPSPLGPLRITASGRGVQRLEWFDPVPGGAPAIEAAHGNTPADDAARSAVAVLDRAATQLDEYFAGERTAFDVPLDVQGTAFQRRAWDVLTAIPYGTTLTYGQQAAAMGSPTASRAVGGANGRNPVPVIVPCHRVIGADGSLTGFAGRLDLKAWLLEHERQHRHLQGSTQRRADG